MELREAEVDSARRRVGRLRKYVVSSVLRCKLFTELSSADIAIGVTSMYSREFKGYRYVWTTPFTAKNVETIWYCSQRAQSKTFRREAGKTKDNEALRSYLWHFKKVVEGGRADEMSVVDPRSYGNVESAINLVGEIMRLFEFFADD